MSKMPLVSIMCGLLLSACAQQNDADDIIQTPMNPKGTQKEVISEEAKAELLIEGNWFTRDPILNGEEGVSSDKAIAELQLPEVSEVIVAVIDSGVDTEHEDLQGKIWLNPGESGLDENGNNKATNGIDDDGNGYVDDIHGWNFIGGADGSHIDYETLEMTREVVRLKSKVASGVELSEEEKVYFEKVQKAVADEREYASSRIEKYQPVGDKIEAMKKLLQDKLGLTEFTKSSLEAISSSDEEVIAAKDHLLETIAKFGSVNRIASALEYYHAVLDYYTNESFDPRSQIVKDDPSDFSDTNYGNNDVKGPDAGHGTHVSGIIAAVRGNSLGVDGIAPNVKIMALRAVPNGDERDKDIALAIKYAADNGAKIINMSFGKAFSPYKEKVDEAFMYAAEKGVLIMNAAGNDNANTDVVRSFPNKYLKSSAYSVTEVPAFLSVGASSRVKGLALPANFSNYGKESVDFFAPGHRILSTTPDNTYDTYSGTSMACPAAAGVAALVLGHYPELSAVQLAEILKRTSRLYSGLEVRQPGAAQFDLPVAFEALSLTGGVVDAYSALEFTKYLAEH